MAARGENSKEAKAIGQVAGARVCVCADSRRIRSEDLFAGATRVVIDHQDTIYRLQITSQGKLLLTK